MSEDALRGHFRTAHQQRRTQLDLSGMQLKNTDVVIVAEELRQPRNETLRTLKLNDNNIVKKGAKHLAKALKVNSTLKSLELNTNSNFCNKAAMAIAKALKENTGGLETIFLNHNNIGSGACACFSKALMNNTKLTKLELSHNNIGDEGAAKIAEGLKANWRLRALNLDNNGIGAEGGIAIANALKTNVALCILKLNGNSIGAAGANAFGEALQVNSALYHFALNNNNIGQNSMRAVADGLLVNTTLLRLCLQGNIIGDAETVEIAEGLSVNTGLQIFDLENNNIGSTGLAALSDALKLNSTPSLRALQLQGNIINNDGVISLTNIQVSLAMGVTDRFFQSLRFKVERGLCTSVAIPYNLYLLREMANTLALGLHENTTVTELKLPLEDFWRGEDIRGNLAPLLQYIEQSNTLLQLTCILRKGDDARENRFSADAGVVRAFFDAVANRSEAANHIEFTLAVNLRWLDKRRNFQVLKDLMQRNEYSFLKKLIFIDYKSGGNDLDGILDREQLVSPLKLESLSIEVATPCGRWLKAWAAAARESPLRVFSLKVKDLPSLRQLFKTLPELVHLQELHVEFVGAAAVAMRQNQHREFLTALKKNGSLQVVEGSVQDENGIPQDLPHHVQWYRQRNEGMPRLMAAGRAHNPNDADNCTPVAQGAVPPLSLYPKLLYQSSQCPGKGLAWMLSGMMQMGDDGVCDDE